jgi:hypothetical protein
MVTVPGATAETRPVDDTVATAKALLDHDVFAVEPDPSITVICTVRPGRIDAIAGEMEKPEAVVL